MFCGGRLIDADLGEPCLCAALVSDSSFLILSLVQCRTTCLTQWHDGIYSQTQTFRCLHFLKFTFIKHRSSAQLSEFFKLSITKFCHCTTTILY